MMRSLFSGVSGLRIHQTKMDVLGNNIANVNTVGFKASRVTFSEVFTQTLSGASAPNAASGRGGLNPMQVGLGSSIASIDLQMTQGASQRTDAPLDVKINGSGFFIVGDESGTYFTKAGAFRLDVAGNLVMPNGMNVLGWQATESSTKPGTQDIVKTQATPLSITSPDKMSIAPVSTKNISLAGNLSTLDETVNKTMSFFDSLGNRYEIAVNFTQDPSALNTWNVNFGKQLIMNGDTDKPIPVNVDDPDPIVFDNFGNIKPVNPTPDVDSNLSQHQILLDLSDVIAGLPVDAGFGEKEIDPVTGDATSSNLIVLDFSNLKSYESVTDAKIRTLDGNSAGQLSGYSIDTSGIITGRYSNGDTKTLGQIAMANFDNPAGLQKLGENLFVTSPNSGGFDGIGDDPQTGGGSLSSGVLEMSNVDLSGEFTEMITTQRGFQANSRVITTSDDMLQELISLKR